MHAAQAAAREADRDEVDEILDSVYEEPELEPEEPEVEPELGKGRRKKVFTPRAAEIQAEKAAARGARARRRGGEKEVREKENPANASLDAKIAKIAARQAREKEAARARYFESCEIESD